MHIERPEKNQESEKSSLGTDFEGGVVRRARELADAVEKGGTTPTKILEGIHDAQHEAAQAAGQVLMQAVILAVQEVFEKNQTPTKDDINAAVLNSMQDVINSHFSLVRLRQRPISETN